MALLAPFRQLFGCRRTALSPRYTPFSAASRRDLTYPSFLVDATRHLERVPTGPRLNPFRRFHTFSVSLKAPGTPEDFYHLAERLLTGQVHDAAGAPLITREGCVTPHGPGVRLPRVLGNGRAQIKPMDVVYVTFWGLWAPCLVLAGGVEKNGDANTEHMLARLTYGTLPGHAECGEETFELKYHNGQLTAWVGAFSRAGRWYTMLGGPIARVVQRWMARRYAEALLGRR